MSAWTNIADKSLLAFICKLAMTDKCLAMCYQHPLFHQAKEVENQTENIHLRFNKGHSKRKKQSIALP